MFQRRKIVHTLLRLISEPFYTKVCTFVCILSQGNYKNKRCAGAVGKKNRYRNCYRRYTHWGCMSHSAPKSLKKKILLMINLENYNYYVIYNRQQFTKHPSSPPPPDKKRKKKNRFMKLLNKSSVEPSLYINHLSMVRIKKNL